MGSRVRPLGIVSAMPEEMDSLGIALDRGRGRAIAGYRFRPGHLDGHPVVLAQAGVGKVASALVGSLLLDRFGCRALIFSGVAGGLDPKLAIGDVIVADELIQHDYGAVIGGRLKPYHPGTPPIGEPQQRPPFRLAPALRQAIADRIAELRVPFAAGAVKRDARVLLGRVLSGDQFVNCAETRDRLHADFGGQAVEMEGAALAQVAERFGAPCIVVRCLSDLAGADSHVDFATFLPAAANAAATVVRRLLPLIMP
ncbi:MAG TPA: 5'-methylthioadenosine/adenosylhomocysteine nucleosidase [Dongiaceae bacterium]|nr:5'-methylthioadenosine/adenosylhomocysteine nucleosidase [Dongiaceae bacterium]